MKVFSGNISGILKVMTRLLPAKEKTAIELVEKHLPAVVLLDLGLPPDPDGTTEGFAILAEILKVHPLAKVIVASGHEARESALKSNFRRRL